MGKLSCQSGLTFQIYFQILLLARFEVLFIWLPLCSGMMLVLSRNLWCAIFLCLVWIYLPFEVTATNYQVLQVCKKLKINYSNQKWNKTSPKSVLGHVAFPINGPKSSQILNILQFWSILLNSAQFNMSKITFWE